MPPLAYTDAAGRPVGFAVEAIDEAGRRAGYKIDWRPGFGVTANSAGLSRGDFDILVGFPSPERRRVFYVSDPWWSFDLAALAPGTGPIRLEADLKGRTLAVAESAVVPVRERYGERQVVVEGTHRAAVEMVCTGKAEAAIVSDIQVRDFLLSPQKACLGLGLRMIDIPTRLDLALIARRDAAGSAQALRKALDEMTSDGGLASIASHNPQFATAHLARLVTAASLRMQRRIWIISLAAFLIIGALGAAWIVKQRRLNARLERDLDARIRAERALQDSEARFRALFDSAPQTVLAMDREGLISFVNHKAEEMFGRPCEELAGKSAETLLPERLRAAFRADRLAGRPGVQGLRADGKEFPIEIELGAVNTGEGLTLAFIADVSERIALQQQLLQAQKLESVGRLTGGVAHDFNNLLTVIRGYAQLVLDDTHTAAKVREPLNEIARAADRAAALTGQLLMFSRRQTGAPRIISLNETLNNLEKMMRRMIGEDVKLVLALHPGAPDVNADPVHIEQVVMNLALNARDAMPEGGDLIIETGGFQVDEEYAATRVELRPGEYALLKVSDSGVGMPPEVQAHMFEPFFTTKEPGKGTGLGLSTVYGIVKQSGGAVLVYSEPGRGTTFKILLPAAGTARALEARGEEKPRALGGNETVLVAEDEQGVRKFVMDVLRSQGYTVLEAPNGAAALEVADAHRGPIHALLTDIVMPEMGGTDLAKRFRETHPGCPVLLMSGYSDRLLEPELADSLIEKPCTPSTLLRRVREAIDGAK